MNKSKNVASKSDKVQSTNRQVKANLETLLEFRKNQGNVPTLPTPLTPDIKPGIYWWDSVANVGKAFGKSPAQVQAACTFHGLAKAVEVFNAERMVDALEAIISISTTDGQIQAMGFVNDQLIYCNGKKTKVLTLKESVACYMKIYKGWMEHDGDHDCSEDALMRWHGMIAKAL